MFWKSEKKKTDEKYEQIRSLIDVGKTAAFRTWQGRPW